MNECIAWFPIGILILAACAPAIPPPATPTQMATAIQAEPGQPLSMPTLVATSRPTSAAAPLPNRYSDTQTVFTILNEEQASGVDGSPPPDWRAWGAPAFTLAPDGSFWILDSAGAHPPRLLHFGPRGDTLGELSLDGLVAGAVDLAVTADSLFVLALATQPAVILRLDWAGNPLSSCQTPAHLFEHSGIYVNNMLDNLLLGAQGELLLKDPARPNLYEFLDATGALTARPMEAYFYAGRNYRLLPGQPLGIAVDDLVVEVPPATPQGRAIWADLLAVAPDGSFYLAVSEEQLQAGVSPAFSRVVRRYSPTGIDLGLALPPESAIPAESNRDLAMGPDGALYALVSRPDHSVDILRLGFAPQLPEASDDPPAATPVPTPLTPQLPTWATPPPGATDLELARWSLLSFFTSLHEGLYAEAALLYGGSYEDLPVVSDDAQSEDKAVVWQQQCWLLQCLLVADVVEESQLAPGEFRFVVEFMNDDGTLFVRGPCCGATQAEMPPVWQFPYTVKRIDGQFRVMSPPVYVP